MCNVFIHQLLEFSVFIKTLGSLNLDGHNIHTRFCCYLLFLPMFYDFFVECFYCKIWSRDNWQVALDNDWLIAWLCNCWHVVKHGMESGVYFGVFFKKKNLFKNAFYFIYKNSDYNVFPVEGIIWRIDYIKIYGWSK